MAITELTDAEIREYLLGKCSTDKSGWLDELSFSDQFSDRIGTVERDLVDEYVNNSLNPDERSAFESHYLNSPIRRERVIFAEAFAKYSEGPHTTSVPNPVKTSIFDLFRQSFAGIRLAAAALLLVFIGTAAWLILRHQAAEVALDPQIAPVPEAAATSENRELAAEPSDPMSAAPVDEPSSSEPRVTPPRRSNTSSPVRSKPRETKPSLAIFVLSPALRSTAFQPVEIPSGTLSTEFRLRLETDGPGPFAAEVVDLRTGTAIWSARRIPVQRSRSGPSASIRVPARTLNAGEFRISLTRAVNPGESEKVGDYFFRVAQ